MNFPKKARLAARSRLGYNGPTPTTITERGTTEDRRATPGRVAASRQSAVKGVASLYSPDVLKKAVAQAKLRRGKAH